MSITNDIDSLTNKVAGLLRKAERTDNEHEAAIFVAKAQELMARNSIDEAMIAAAGEGGKTPEQVITKTYLLDGTYLPRKATLLHNIATNVGVKTCLMSKTCMSLTGTPADIAWAETLYDSLVAQMQHALKVADRERRAVRPMPRPSVEPYGETWNSLSKEERTTLRAEWDVYRINQRMFATAQENGRTFATAFIAGFTNRVANRLREVNMKARREAEAEQGHGVALVLASKAERVEAEYKIAHPRVVSRRSNSVRGSGYYAGQSAGSNASFARGVGGSSSRGALGA
jgi:hypothetical protein